MGLDMYLSKRTYLGLNFPHNRKEGNPLKIDGEKHAHIQPDRVSEITEQAGYWRKANAIHKWFVDNVQNGVDDCGEYRVDREQLQELLDVVNRVMDSTELVDGQVSHGYTYKADGTKEHILKPGKVLSNPAVAQEHLPVQEGFFFGGTDYDEWYWRDLVDTKAILEEALAEENVWVSYYYHSSW